MHRTVSILLLALPAFGQSPFSWKDPGGGRVELSEGGKPTLVYNYGPQWKQGAPEDRRRCCYIFPVYTPAGVSMLDDFPQDHWHHRGLFWSWPVVEVGGKKYDIWMTFTAKHRSEKPPVTSGGTLRAENFWEAGGKDIVKEDLRLTVLPVRANVREIDVELTWEALGAPVTLRGSAEAGKSYGGLSARFAAREGTTLRADGEVLKKDEDLTAADHAGCQESRCSIPVVLARIWLCGGFVPGAHGDGGGTYARTRQAADPEVPGAGKGCDVGESERRSDAQGGALCHLIPAD
ncbi:MAG: PmoA family protein [Candidatus Solibacter sp.]|nr:PmoA family protein [Candidatus Solibacter sp.]